jgi:hypothetical protein
VKITKVVVNQRDNLEITMEGEAGNEYVGEVRRVDFIVMWTDSSIDKFEKGIGEGEDGDT